MKKAYFIGKKQAGQTVVAVVKPKGGGYRIYSPLEFEQLSEKLNALPDQDPTAREMKRLTLGYAQRVVIGSDGMAELLSL